jgi:hypothetical protein
MDAVVFGWSCIVIYRPYGCAYVTEKEIHRRGKTPGCVTSAAKRMNGYRSHRDVTPYTKEQWVRVFGCGSETGRYMVG